MPSMAKLLPVALVVVLLAGCRDGARVDESASRPALLPGPAPSSPQPSQTSTDPAHPCGGPDAPPCGQTPTPDASTPSDDSGSKVPDACGLITRAEILNAVGHAVTIRWQGDAHGRPPYDDSVAGAGYRSSCAQTLTSEYADNGISIVGGEVEVVVQTDGAGRYFPVRQPGDKEVGGLGDDAMTRVATLYVRLGDGLLTINVGISNPAGNNFSNVNDAINAINAQRLVWAEHLAPIAIDRIRQFQQLHG